MPQSTQHLTPQALPDFDTLKDLAVRDPAAFEALRRAQIEALIEKAPPPQQRRLRGLQFQIDAQRRLHANPLAACIKISQMMHDSLQELRELLDGWGKPEPLAAVQQSPRRSADIVAFPSRR